jgi:murein DD-endopeptidase MepM/ murein hydrolase activator NlpD
MRSRPLRVVAWLLLALAFAGLAAQVALSGLPEPLAAVLFTPTPTATNTPTPTPTFTPTPTATPTPTPEPLDVSITVEPMALSQGGTAAIEVQSNREVTLTGTLGELPLDFVELEGSYWALSGFSSWAAVGPNEIVIEARSALGEEVRVTGVITVTYGQFPTEIIDIPSDREYLLDPEIVREERERLAAIYDQLSPSKLWDDVFGYPVDTLTVTSMYGAIRQYDTGPGRHAGVDLDGEVGDPVYAVADGQVILSEALQVRGNTVILDHGLGVYTIYCHLSDLAVEEGDVVTKGQLIGLLGSTGLSTGAHLHWETRVGGVAVDPFEWTRRRILP